MEKYVNKPKIYYIKPKVEKHEYMMHKYLYKLDILNIPKAVYYDKSSKTMVLARVNGMSISDMYGEDISNVPDDVYVKVVEIMRILILFNVCYPDFTGYNFMIDNKNRLKIWIIDFEHAYCKEYIDDNFVKYVIDGGKKWNKEFE